MPHIVGKDRDFFLMISISYENILKKDHLPQYMSSITSLLCCYDVINSFDDFLNGNSLIICNYSAYD